MMAQLHAGGLQFPSIFFKLLEQFVCSLLASLALLLELQFGLLTFGCQDSLHSLGESIFSADASTLTLW